MVTFEAIINFLFSIALIINAVLFLPQCLRVIRLKTSKDLSLTTFIGFFTIQLLTAIYAYLHKDSILFYGILFAMLMCGTLVILIIRYRPRSAKSEISILHKQLTGRELSHDAAAEDLVHYYKSILDLMPGNVYWKNRDGIFMGCNKNMLDFLGLEDESEYIGKTYEDLYEKTHIQKIKQTDMEIMQSGKAMSIEEIAVPYHVYYTHKIPLHDKNGKVCGLLGISLDITERKQAELALAKAKQKSDELSKMKTDFIRNMRHDIKTPITNIVGLSHILRQLATSTESQLLADDLVKSGESILSLIDEMFEYTSITDGKMPIVEQPFDIEALIDSVSNMLLAQALSKNVCFEKDIEQDIPKLIGDRTRVRRIILNLLHNAIKFTDHGRISISVTTQYVSNTKIRLTIKVADTGIGISESDQSVIFNEFTKLTPSHTNRYPGSGLGLSIVKQFVDDMNGEISVESIKGKGTTFTCHLNLEFVEQELNERGLYAA